LASSGRFKNTVPHYPLRGHSFNHCDRDLATVQKKIISRNHRIYPRVEQVALIKEKARNFTVYKVDNSKNITHFKKWWHKH